MDGSTEKLQIFYQTIPLAKTQQEN